MAVPGQGILRPAAAELTASASDTYVAYCPPVIGRELDGRYRVLEHLGEGGMGEVYLVEHFHLGRKEALKVLHPGHASSSQHMTRFRREARALNRVTHPNIITVYNFGQLPDGRLYLAMEYAEGEVLSSVVQRIGPLPATRTLRILAQIAAAIDHAHSRGVIHRDLKPDNVMVVSSPGGSDTVKVLDFGLAKIIDPGYRESIQASKQGEIPGTPAYMAPERIAGKPDAPSTDIYALACIGFYALVGEPPFSGRPMEILHAHMATPFPQPSQCRPEARIPAELESLLMRCAEKDPDQRPRTGAEVLAALRAVPGFDSASSTNRKLRWSGRPDSDMGIEDFVEEDTFLESSDPETTRLEFGLNFAEAEAVHSGLVELAQALLDLGCHDVPLVVAVSEVLELQVEMRRLDAELDELTRRADSAEDILREREARLRFSIGELEFELRGCPADAPHRGDLEKQLRYMQNRLQSAMSESSAEEAALRDRGLAVVTARMGKNEELRGLVGSLRDIVLRVGPEFADAPEVEEGLARLPEE